MKELVNVVQVAETDSPRLRAIPEGYASITVGVDASMGVERVTASPLSIPRLAAAIEREGARLVHAHGAVAAALAVPAARLVGARVIVGRDLPASSRALAFAQAVAARAADAVCAVSDVAAEAALFEGAVRERVHTVTGGVEVPQVSTKDPVLVAVPGPLTMAHADLFEALERARLAFPALRVVCGDEARSERVQALLDLQLSARGLRKCVELGKPDLARASIAVFVEPVEEHRLLQAMAARCAVVAVEGGAARGLVEELVPARRADVWAERLLALLATPEKVQALGTAARKRVEKEHTLDALAKRTGALWSSLLAPAAPARPPAEKPAAKAA